MAKPDWTNFPSVNGQTDFTTLTSGSSSLPSDGRSGLIFTRNSAATVQTGTSTLVSTSIGPNVVAIGRSLDSDPLGLQHEISSSNLISSSREVGSAGWLAGSSVATTIQAAAGPDGAVLADQSNLALASGFSKYVQVAMNGPVAFSMWERYTTGSINNLKVNLGTGSFIVACGPTWQRFTNSENETSGVLSYVGPITLQVANIYSDYHQIETGGYATSAIVTTGSAITRAGSRIQYSNPLTRIFNGRLNLEIDLRPIGSADAFRSGSSHMRLWTDCGNQANYVEINKDTRVLSMSVGSENRTMFSQNIENAYWIKSACVVTASTVDTTDPLGGSTACKVVDDATGATHRFAVSSAESNVVVGGIYTQSIYAKAGTKSIIGIMADSGTSQITFNLSTQLISAINSTNVISRAIVAVGNGWYRCSITYVRATGGFLPFFYMINVDSVATYTGDGTGTLYFWGAQNCISDFAGPYVATSASAVVPSINTTQLPFWNANDRLQLFVGVGGNQTSTVAYAIGGISGSIPTLSGSALGNLAPTGSMDLLCNNTSSQFSSFIAAERTYANGISSSQNQPTWVTNNFVPTSIPGCMLWLKADAGITKDAANLVSTWADQSGNNNHATQAVGVNQPFWSVSDTQYSGSNTVIFSGSQYMSTPAIDLTSGYTVFSVSRVSGTLAGSWSGLHRQESAISTGTTGNTIYISNPNVIWGTTNASITRTAATVWTLGQKHLMTARMGLSGSTADLRIDGVSKTLGVETGGVLTICPTAQPIWIGGGWSNAGSYANGGDIERIVYNRKLTDTEVNQVEAYLAPKVGGIVQPSPLLTTGLELNLDARVGVILNGLSASRWNDQSGNGRNVSQVISANQPLYLSASGINGLPSFSLNGGALFMQSVFSTPFFPRTIYIVGYTLQDQIRNLIDGQNTNTRVSVRAGTSSGYNLFVAPSTTISTTAAITTAKVLCTVINGASSAMYADDMVTSTGTGAATSVNLDGLTVMAAFDGSQPMSGQLSHILMYSIVHTQDQRNQVKNFLRGIWGTT